MEESKEQGTVTTPNLQTAFMFDFAHFDHSFAGTEDLEMSVADRYHGSVLQWHDLSAKEKKTLRGEHLDAVNEHR